MPSPFLSARRLLLALACAATLRPQEAAADTRWIHCARTCRLELGGQVTGSVGVKVSPYAQIYLTRLYATGDSYQLQAGRDYFLDLTESPKDGYFKFELRLTPEGQEAARVYEVRATPEDPFISITPKGADATPGTGTFVLSTDRKSPLIDIQ